MSPLLIPAPAARELGNGSRATHGARERTPAVSACSSVSKIGMSPVPCPTRERRALGASSRIWTVSGSVHWKNNTPKRNPARRKFIVTPARRIATCCHHVARGKASLSRLSGSEKCSPLRRTNQPRGIQLMVQSVPFLSLKMRTSLGGIPIPNS